MALVDPALPESERSFIYADRTGKEVTVTYTAIPFDDAGREGSWDKGFELVLDNDRIEYGPIVVCEPGPNSTFQVVTYYSSVPAPQTTEINPGRPAPSMAKRFDYELWHELCQY